MRNRYVGPAAAVVALLMTTTACGGAQKAPVLGLPSANIATALTKTGFAAVFGQSQQSAVELAVAQLRTEKIADLKLVASEDTGESNASALNAYRKLLGKEPDLVIGPIVGTMMLAMRQEVDRAQIPMVTTAATRQITQKGNKYIFRNFPHSAMTVEGTSEYAFKELKVKRPAILADNTAFGQGDASALVAAAKSAGVPIVANESVSPTAVDVTGQVSRINRAKADAVFVQLLTGSPLAVAVKALRRSGFQGAIFAAPGITSPSTLQLLSNDEVQGVFSPGLALDLKNLKTQAFEAAFKKKFNKEPDIYAAVMYDSIMAVGQVVADGNTSPEEITSALKKIQYDGLTAKLRSDSEGNLVHSVSVLKFDGSKKAAPVKTVELGF